MNIEHVRTTNTTTAFKVEGVSTAYANTLRRLFKKHVPTMAIETVEFKANNSALYDEIIAHRLGLLVLSTDLGTFNMPEPGAEETAATHTQLSLIAEGPCTVYAKDLEPQTESVKPVHPDTPIVKLLEGQSLELVASARLGTGQEHSKHDPGLISYYYEPTITIQDDISNDTLQKYPPHIVEDGTVVEENILSSPQLIDACEGVSKAVTIEYTKPQTSFIFTVEPWGQLTPQEIVSEGLRIHNEQLDTFEEALEQL